MHFESYVLAIMYKTVSSWGQLKTVEMETGNGNSQNLMQMNARIKPLINDHLYTNTNSVQRPYKIYVPKITDDWNILLQRPPYVKTTFQ